MFENVDGRTDGRQTTDARVTGILIAHLGAFGSGELIRGVDEGSGQTLCLLAHYIAALLAVHAYK